VGPFGDEVREDIEQLRPGSVIDETPAGWMRAIDEDKRCLYDQMWVKVKSGPGDTAEEVFEQEMQDMLAILIDLDKRQAEVFHEDGVLWFARLDRARERQDRERSGV
jgi:hypothetical protein